MNTGIFRTQGIFPYLLEVNKTVKHQPSHSGCSEFVGWAAGITGQLLWAESCEEDIITHFFCTLIDLRKMP